MKVTRIQRLEVPDLSERIIEAQKKSGKSVAEIAKEAGFSRSYWYQVISDKEEAIAIETLRKIEKILNVDFGVEFE